MASNPPTIPRKGISESAYAVHRPSEAGEASSQQPQPYRDIEEDHEQQDDHNERSNTPPPYSGPTTPSMTTPAPIPNQIPRYPGLPRLNYDLYRPASFTLSSDKTTISSRDPRLSNYPDALIFLIQSLATVPPKPQVRIQGTNSSTGTTDFDIQLNMMNLFVAPDGDKERRMNYVRVVGKGESAFRGEGKRTTMPEVHGLENWARKFCADKGTAKHFTLERTLTNWDTSYIEGRLFSLVSSTSYRGHVVITFPVTHSKVVIHSPENFFSNVAKVFTGTRKYEVVQSVWPYADLNRAEPGRKVVVQEEEIWFREWKDAIAHAVMARRKGWVTVEDRLEGLMEPVIVK